MPESDESGSGPAFLPVTRHIWFAQPTLGCGFTLATLVRSGKVDTVLRLGCNALPRSLIGVVSLRRWLSHTLSDLIWCRWVRH
jgi:hypothetical protein